MINSLLKTLSSRFSLVLSAAALISALAIVGLLPMAVESIIHDIKGIASKQQFFTEDLTDTGQHFTDLELLIKQVDELGQVATIEISGERSCVSPCGSFTDKITFFGINDQTKGNHPVKNGGITERPANPFEKRLDHNSGRKYICFR
jgi:hypothetical protein